MTDYNKVQNLETDTYAGFKKKRMAFNINGSLLELAMKLRSTEVRVLNKTHTETPKWPDKGQFQSIVGNEGFRFSTTSEKRKAAEEAEVRDFQSKRCCIRAETSHGSTEGELSNFKLPVDERLAESNISDKNQSFANVIELMENNKVNKVSLQNMILIKYILENLRKWKTVGKTGSDGLTDQAGKMPLEFSLWSLMSCTKNLVGDEALRIIEHKNISCLTKSKVNYASWKMTQKDLKSVEQIAIDHIVRSKSSDLECRLALKLRKMSKQANSVVGEHQASNSKLQKMKALPLNHLSNVTWNSVVRRKFKCEHCVYQTDNRSHLLRHQSSIHNMFKPYQCYICTKEFSRVEYIKQHLLTAHPGVKYDATRAKNELAFREQMPRLTQEIRKSEDISDRLRWNQGDQEEIINGSLGQKFHSTGADCSRSVAMEFLGEDHRDLLCSYCDFATQNSTDFQQHLKKCRPSEDLFCCRLCSETFPSRSHLQVHSATTHLTILYCCHSCPFYTLSLNTYDWHVAQVHSSWKDQHSCPICCQSFAKQCELVQHIDVMHLKKVNFRSNDTISASLELGWWSSRPTNSYSECFQNRKRAMGNDNHWQNGMNKSKV